MEPLRKRVIQENWKYICDNLHAEDLLPCLFQAGFVSKNDEEHIKNEPTTVEKANKLLRILKAKPSYDAFLHALEEQGYHFIKEELAKTEKDLLAGQQKVHPDQRSTPFMQPGKPTRVETTLDSITIKWDFNEDELDKVDNFEVKYKIKGEKRWPGVFFTSSNDCEANITRLQSNTVYEFRVRANYGDEEGDMSLISDPISTKYPVLDKPIEHITTDCEISVKWFKLSGCEIEKYEMNTKVEDDSVWESTSLDPRSAIFTKQNVIANTKYQFQDCAITKKGPFIYSDICHIQTLYPTPRPSVVNVNIETKYEADVNYVNVKYREDSQNSDWQSLRCEVRDRHFNVTKLQGDTTYVFKVQLVYKDNTSSFSEECHNLKTKRGFPTKPLFVYKSSHRIAVRWTGPEGIDQNVSFYEIYFRQENATNWMIGQHSESDLCFTAENLHASTSYVFKVCAVFGDERGLFSQESEPIKTEDSLAKCLSNKSKKRSNIGGTSNMYDVYQIPLKDINRNDTARYRTCAFDIHATKAYTSSEEKTLMLVGGTGAGKSLMVEAFANYILDVNFSDDFRLSLVNLTKSEERKVNNQSISQTEWITMYQIPHMDESRIEYKMNIIDTPGFGDTSGSDADDRHIDNIETFFKSDGNLSIDAIGFVIEASQSRLNAGQKKLFQKIFSIFGNDFKRNIFLFVTFADEFEPKVLAAIHAETISFAKQYKFNNGGLFVNSAISKGSFDMAFHSLSEFFKHLSESPNVSLKKTTENMEKQRQLTATVQGIKPQIQVGFMNLESLRQQVKVIEKHKADIKKDKDFEFSVDTLCKEKIKKGKWSTNCKICEVTCHYPCWYTPRILNRFCQVMSKSKCTVCEKKCSCEDHEMSEYSYVVFVKKVKQSFNNFAQKYEKDIKGPQNQEKIADALKRDIKKAWKQIGTDIEKISELIKEINKIALRHVPYTAIEYIDQLITEENDKPESSIPEEMALLTILKNHAKTMVKSNVAPKWEDIAVDDMLEMWNKEAKRLKSSKH